MRDESLEPHKSSRVGPSQGQRRLGQGRGDASGISDSTARSTSGPTSRSAACSGGLAWSGSRRVPTQSSIAPGLCIPSSLVSWTFRRGRLDASGAVRPTLPVTSATCAVCVPPRTERSARTSADSGCRLAPCRPGLSAGPSTPPRPRGGDRRPPPCRFGLALGADRDNFRDRVCSGGSRRRLHVISQSGFGADSVASRKRTL